MCINGPRAQQAAMQGAGIGADTTVTEGKYTKLLLHRVFALTRFWEVTPKLWNISQGFAIPKAAVPGPKGKRVVHGLDPLSKGFYAGILKVGPK
eukprot:3283796-Pyramimonas_sp.AAC.1